jgi:hypothetical protein
MVMIDNYAESSRFNSIEKYKLQALAIDQLGRGSTAALKILKKWVNRDRWTKVNEQVTYDSVRIIERRAGPLGPMVNKERAIQEAKDKNCDIVEIAAAPGGFSVCLQTSYKALMLNYIEVLLMKQQHVAEGTRNRNRKFFIMPMDAPEAMITHKCQNMALALINGRTVQLAIMYLPDHWKQRIPLKEEAVPKKRKDDLQEDLTLVNDEVKRGGRVVVLKGSDNDDIYEEMQFFHDTLQNLLYDNLRHLRGSPEEPHANGPVKASYMGKPLMRTEYTLYSTKRQPKIRRKLKKKK